MSMFKTREEMDEIAWSILDDSEPTPRVASVLPGNLVDLYNAFQRTDLPYAWGNFLHDFFAHKDEESFRLPPPPEFGIERCAFFAAVAEYLSRRYKLPVPQWAMRDEYVLAERWDPAHEEFQAEMPGEAGRWERTPEEFRRRNVVYEARNLIVL